VDLLRISVLGPLEVFSEGQALALPQSKKARALLAYLAITGRRRTRAQLCDMFWDVADDPRAGLRWCLSRLRRVINEGAEVLVSDRNSVGLAAEQLTVDSITIASRLVADQEPTVDELRDMAAAFRGPLLEGLDFPDLHAVQAWLIAQRSEARQLRCEVHERLVSLLEDPEEAIPYARALVQEAPQSEAWHVRLVELLLAAGHKVEAEQQYAAGMRELEAQGSGTHALRLAWRRGSVAPRDDEMNATPLEQLAGSPFVGRSAELAAVEGLVEAATRGSGGTLTIAGEPGIGKSRLIREVARRAAAGGVMVLEGSCANAAYALPYLPFIEALDAAAADLPCERLAHELPLLARILPQLAQRQGIDVEPEATEEMDRYALFRAVAALLDELAGDRGLVLLLEDLHWADTQSLLMISYLARLLGDTRVLLIGTYRDVEVSRAHPLSEALVALKREPRHTRMSLKRLDHDSAASLIATLSNADRSLVEAVFAQTEGHPLFIEEVIKHLLEEGCVGAGQDTSLASLGLPEGVRDVIGRRLSRLSKSCNRMLACASALTGAISWPILVATCEQDEDELLDYLDEALAAQVVRERPGSRVGSYEFTHALIQQALYEELSTSRRLRLHRRIAEAIERVHGDHLDPHLVELAHHYYEAAPAGSLDKFLDYSMRAGARATGLMAFEEAAQLYDRALGTLDELEREEHPVRGRLHQLYAGTLASMSRWPDAHVHYEQALERVPDGEDHTRARLILHAAVCDFWMLDIARVRARATEALALAEASGDVELTSAAEGLLAMAEHSDGEVREAEERYRRAGARVSGSSDLLVAQALQQFPITLYWTGRFEDSVARSQELLKTARSHSDGSMVMNLLAVTGMALGCAGRYRESREIFRQAAQFGRDHEIGRLLARSECMQAGCLFELGAVELARGRAEEALEAARSAEFAPSVMSTQIDLLLLDIARGEIGAAQQRLPEVERQLADTRGFHGWVWWQRVALAQSQLSLAAGQDQEARAVAGRLIEAAERTGRVKYQVAGHRVVAAAQLAAGDPGGAIASLRVAAAAAGSIHYPALLVQVAGDLLPLAEEPELLQSARSAVDGIIAELDDVAVRAAFERSVAVQRIRG
jgi:DNA-binding SARP family transcriptional activator/tetratricopeptide (TPR) repeat protein